MRTDNPADDVDRPRWSAGPRPPATELRRLLEVLPDTDGGRRDRAIIITAVMTGLRRVEVLGLTRARIEDDGEVAFYVTRVKGGKERRRELPCPALDAIASYWQARGRSLDELPPDERIFPVTGAGFAKNLRRYGTKAGLSGLHPHVLLALVGELRRDSGETLEAVLQHLGHASLSTTSRSDPGKARRVAAYRLAGICRRAGPALMTRGGDSATNAACSAALSLGGQINVVATRTLRATPALSTPRPSEAPNLPPEKGCRMTEDALSSTEPFTPDELAQLTADGIDPATAYKLGGRVFYRLPVSVRKSPLRAPKASRPILVVLTTDWTPGATEDDIKLAAMQHRNDVKALEGHFTPEQVEGAVADLEAADIFRALVDMAVSIVRDSALLSVTDDPDPAPLEELTDDERQRVAERATVRCTKMAATLAQVCLTGDNAPAFKRDFALHLLTQSWAWALADAREFADELEAQAGEAMPPEAFTELHHRTYHEGTYWTRALLDHTHQVAIALAKQVGRVLKRRPT